MSGLLAGFASRIPRIASSFALGFQSDLSLGLLGIFVGPVVLAVSYTLLEAWINEPAHAA